MTTPLTIGRIRVRGVWAWPLGLAVVVAVFVAWWAPVLVRERVLMTVDARLGLRASVADVSVSPAGVTLMGLAMTTAPPQTGVSVTVESVRLETSLFALVFRGSAAVEDIEAHGVRVAADVASGGFDALLAKVRAGRDHAESGKSSAAPGRTLHADRVAISIKRAATSLMELSGAKLSVGTNELLATLPSLRLADGRRLSAQLQGVELRGLRGESGQGWQLRRLTVATAALRAEAPRASVGAVTAPSDLDADEDAAPKSDFVPEPSARPAAQAAPAGIAKRATVSPVAFIMARLAPGAELVVQRASLTAVSGDGHAQILSEIQARVTREREEQLHVTGHGVTEQAGHLDADLRISPRDLRADGTVTLKDLPLNLLAPLLPNVPWDAPEQSRLSAELLVKTESLERLAIEGHAHLEKGGIFSPRIAATPVHDINIDVEGKGYFYPARRRLEVVSAQLKLGKPKITLSGALELAADHYVIELDASLPRTGCTDAVRSVPADLLADMALATWTGTIGGRIQLQIDSRALEKTKLDFDIKDQCEFSRLPELADLRRFAQPFTHSVIEPDDTVFEMETGPGTEAWTPIEAISPFLIYAVLGHEDPQFFAHHGFSPPHIRTALIRNLEEGRYVVGASTITMQLVKNVFLRREKTLARKLQEVLLTWWIERSMDKREILQLYLNVIEYGPSVYGVRSAAKHYFNRLPAELSPAESVFLATILPAPKRYHAFFEKGAITPGFANVMRQLLKRLREHGFYDAAATEYGMHELEHFSFVPEGGAAPPRTIPGGTVALPYTSAATSDGDSATDVPAPDGYD